MGRLRILFLCGCLLCPMAGMAHQGGHSELSKAGQGAGSKARLKPNTPAPAEASPPQRFCMKNAQGKLHCIPFGPH